jgi:IS5 family transposase
MKLYSLPQSALEKTIAKRMLTLAAPHHKLVTLEAVVGRARQCRDRRARQGARTRRAHARKDEQRRMARRARCWRMRSAVTQKVKVIEAENFNIHAISVRVTSGQLPFLGLPISMTDFGELRHV